MAAICDGDSDKFYLSLTIIGKGKKKNNLGISAVHMIIYIQKVNLFSFTRPLVFLLIS